MLEKNRESFKNLNKLSSRIIYWEHSSCSAISERWIWISPFCRVELKVTCKFWSAAWSFTDNAILFNLRTYLGTRQRFQIESRWFCKSPSRFSTAEGGFGQTYRQRHVVQISSFSKWLRQSFFGLQCPFVDRFYFWCNSNRYVGTFTAVKISFSQTISFFPLHRCRTKRWNEKVLTCLRNVSFSLFFIWFLI